MKKTRLPPIGFLSYARQDDKLSGQKLSRLRRLIKAELQLQYGRETVKLFQDVSTIPHGASWERETLKALNDSTFFVPIITPNFIQSEWCCREVNIFLERERQLFALYPDLPPLSRIFPIDYRRIREGNARDPEALAILKTLQWCDFQDLRDKNPEEEAVSRAIYDFAESICDLLLIEVEAPPTAGERALREAEAEAAREQAEAAGDSEGDSPGSGEGPGGRGPVARWFESRALLSAGLFLMIAVVGIAAILWIRSPARPPDADPPATAAKPNADAAADPAPMAARGEKAAAEGPALHPPPAGAPDSGPTIMLGAFNNEAYAVGAWRDLTGRFPYLTPLAHRIVPGPSAARTVYRLYASGPGAAEICRRLRAAGKDCISMTQPPR